MLVLEGIREILQIVNTEVLPYLVPQLLTVRVCRCHILL
jgi:hypothetical protein